MLRAGFFEFEIEPEAGRVVLWYGHPKQERLASCPLSAKVAAAELVKLRKQLGSQLPERELLTKLREAYMGLSGSEFGEDIPLVPILSAVALLVQSKSFHNDPRKEHYRGYSRADFSYDLYRVKMNAKIPSSGACRLKPAVRAHTGSRKNFIWIPTGPGGDGKPYSHITFEES